MTKIADSTRPMGSKVITNFTIGSYKKKKKTLYHRLLAVWTIKSIIFLSPEDHPIDFFQEGNIWQEVGLSMGWIGCRHGLSNFVPDIGRACQGLSNPDPKIEGPAEDCPIPALKLSGLMSNLIPCNLNRAWALAFSSMKTSFFFLMSEALLIKMIIMAGQGVDQIST